MLRFEQIQIGRDKETGGFKIRDLGVNLAFEIVDLRLEGVRWGGGQHLLETIIPFLVQLPIRQFGNETIAAKGTDTPRLLGIEELRVEFKERSECFGLFSGSASRDATRASRRRVTILVRERKLSGTNSCLFHLKIALMHASLSCRRTVDKVVS